MGLIHTQDDGLKYNTIVAPAANRTNPIYSIGLGGAFGGCISIDATTLIKGAPPKTNGITYMGRPPDLKDHIIQIAPIAPKHPATVAVTVPPELNPSKSP